MAHVLILFMGLLWLLLLMGAIHTASCVELSLATGTESSRPTFNDIRVSTTINWFPFTADDGIHGRQFIIYDLPNNQATQLFSLDSIGASSLSLITPILTNDDSILNGFVFVANDTVAYYWGKNGSAKLLLQALKIHEIISMGEGALLVTAETEDTPGFRSLHLCLALKSQCIQFEDIKDCNDMMLLPEVGVLSRCLTQSEVPSICSVLFGTTKVLIQEVFPLEMVVDEARKLVWFTTYSSNVYRIGRTNGTNYEICSDRNSQPLQLAIVLDRIYYLSHGQLGFTQTNAPESEDFISLPYSGIKLIAAGDTLYIVTTNATGNGLYSYVDGWLVDLNVTFNEQYQTKGTLNGDLFLMTRNIYSAHEYRDTYHYCTTTTCDHEVFAADRNAATEMDEYSIATVRENGTQHVFLRAYSPAFGEELFQWKDGALNVLKDINRTPRSLRASEMVQFGDQYFFSAQTVESGNELFVWNGTDISLYSDLVQGPLSSFPTKLVVCHSALYFVAYNPSSVKFRVWRLLPNDKTPVALPNAGDISEEVSGFLICLGSKLIFATPSAVMTVDNRTSNPGLTFTRFGVSSFVSPPLFGKAYFTVKNRANPILELWVIDLPNIEKIVDISVASDNNVDGFWVVNGSLYFVFEENDEYSLFRSAGVSSATYELNCPGIDPSRIIPTRDYLYALTNSAHLYVIEKDVVSTLNWTADVDANSIWAINETQFLVCNDFNCFYREPLTGTFGDFELPNVDLKFVPPVIWENQEVFIPHQYDADYVQLYHLHVNGNNDVIFTLRNLESISGRLISMKWAGNDLFIETLNTTNGEWTHNMFMISRQELLSEEQISSSHALLSSENEGEGPDFPTLVLSISVAGIIFLCCIPVVLIVTTVIAIFVFRLRKRKNAASPETTPLSVELQDSGSNVTNVATASLSSQSSTALTDSSNSSSHAKSHIMISVDTTKWTDINIQDIDIVSRLGTGAYGIVYKAKYHSEYVALKKLKDMDSYVEQEEMDSVIQEFSREITILAQLRHANVLFFYGACTTFPNLAIVTEFMEKGSLNDLLYKVKENLKFHIRVSMAFDIAKGMSYLHSQQIIHRDLKSHNCLINKNYVAKVADFGMSKIRNAADRHSMTSNVGSVLWMAPEVAMGEQYDSKVDVFSFGIVMSELLTSRVPYSDLDAQMQQMIHFKVAMRSDLRPTVPDTDNIFQGILAAVNKQASESDREALRQIISDFVELMKRCWQRQPTDRPTFAEIVLSLDSQCAAIPKHIFDN